MQPRKNFRTIRFAFAVTLASALAAPWIGAYADVLSDVRTTLQGLDAPVAINGILDIQSIVTRGTGNSAKQISAHLQLSIQTGSGLGIKVSPALLQQIAREKAAHAADPNRPTPTADLLSQTDPWQIESLVSVAPMLLRMLTGAESPKLRSTQLYGRPVRELSVQLPQSLSQSDRANMKDYTSSAALWLNSKGVPLAYVYSVQGKFCKFFLCLSVNHSERGSLQVIDGHLTIVTWIQDNRQSGLGQGGDTRTTYSLLVQHAAKISVPTVTSKPD
jgi:hypothetical protein